MANSGGGGGIGGTTGTVIELTGSFGAIAEAARTAVAQVVKDTAVEIAGDAQQRIQEGDKTGRTYRRGAITRSGGSRNTKLLGGLGLNRVDGEEDGAFIVGYKFHRASAPGESPANDTGALANSIHTDLSHVEADLAAEVIVGEGEIGATLEFGSTDGKIAPRPFLTPAVEAHRESFQNRIDEAVAKAAKDGA